MFLDGAAQFTLIVTGVCLVSDCQCFHMRIPAKNMLFSLYETKKTENLGEELESNLYCFICSENCCGDRASTEAVSLYSLKIEFALDSSPVIKKKKKKSPLASCTKKGSDITLKINIEIGFLEIFILCC